MFNSPELQFAYDDCKEELAKLSLNLDQISHDINKLESYLKGLHLLEDISFTFCTTFEITDEPSGSMQEGNETRYKLCWSSSDKRLCYEITEVLAIIGYEVYPDHDNLSANPYYKFGEEVSFYKRPLIECKVDYRKHALKYLGEFLVYITENYSTLDEIHIPPKISDLEDESIPF